MSRFTNALWKTGSRAICLSLLISLLVLAGQAAAARSTVTMWVFPLLVNQSDNEALWGGLAQRFEKQNPDIDIQVEVLPWAGRDAKLTAALLGGQGPDVTYLIPDQIPQYVNLGVLEPLDDVLTPAEKEDYWPLALKSVTYQGKLYVAPILQSAVPIAYNKKLFKAAGVSKPPTTWQELLDIAPKFKEAGLYATDYTAALEQTLNMSFYPFLWQAEGSVFSQDGTKAAFNSPEGVRALTYIVDLFKKGYVSPASATQMPQAFASPFAREKAAMDLAVDNQTVRALAQRGMELGVAPPLKDKGRVGYGTIGGLALFKTSKSREAAAKWIHFVTSPEVLKEIDLRTGYFAPKKSIGKLYKDDPLLGDLEDTIQYMRAGEVHPQSRRVMGILGPEIQAAILGKKTPEQALNDAAAQVDELIARGK